MQNTKLDPRSAATACCALLALAIWQSIGTSATAALTPILPPPSVLAGALENQTDGYVFIESLKVLAAPLPVDIDTSGLYNSSTPFAAGVIAAGTPVLSYMIHHEAVDGQISSISGSFIFPHPVLGIIYTDAGLDSTDAILGHAGTSYPTGLAFRGFDVTYPTLPDTIFWSGNQVTISVQSNAQLVMDQLRIVVSIPEPSTLLLGGLGVVGLLAIRRRART
jgi:hypothetical protein